MTSRAEPLAGLRVVVTRSVAQASELSDRLRSLGADPYELATIAIEPPPDGGSALRAALASAQRYERIAVASPNGARAMLAAATADLARPFPPVACVGPSTATVLNDTAFTVDLVPDRAVAEGLVETIGPPPHHEAPLLLVQAEVARPVLAEGLAELGWRVDRVAAYRTVDAVVADTEAQQASRCDLITFTSSSTVERFVRLAGAAMVPPTVASIGPITSETARSHGLAVAIEADPHTLDGLVDAIVAWVEAGALGHSA